jgi:FlaA1/EpsC-like NDP-sugar epimerase
MDNWAGKSVLITGVCGTVGGELLRQIVAHGPREIVGLDNNEEALFFLTEEFKSVSNVRLFLADIRDRDELKRKMRGVDIVLHAAAFKHVILCEHSPQNAVQTNILGTQNIIDAAIEAGVSRVLFTSSDKAVNPTNVMGTTKLMGERLITAANAHRKEGGPIFAATRFGNVLGSRGSVIPLFRKQIAAGGPLTLTDPEMTRFIMTLSQAVCLVMESVFLAKGGEVFVTKMPIARIEDLAHVMVELLAPQYGHTPESIEFKIIGAKAGEKLYEELMNDEETRRTLELERYFAVLPAFKAVYEDIHYHYPDVIADKVDNPYNSSIETAMTREELREYLLAHHLLDAAS